VTGKTAFNFIMIKPSHYDNDGYPLRWRRSFVPSNALAAVYGLATDGSRRQVLGDDVEIKLTVIDETNTRVRADRLAAMVQRDGGRAFVALVGVQSNQYPRAVDLARQFIAHGLPVAIGGFHVSGCLAMLPELPPEIAEAKAMGVSLFAGEAEEGRLDEVLRDAWAGSLKPVYNFIDRLPNLAGEPTPFLPREATDKIQTSYASFDVGRGCPFQCSFCTIINVQGRKSRIRSPDDLEHVVIENAAQGVRSFFITDDNFARNKEWESFFDRLIDLKKRGYRISLIIQVDTLCHRIPNFIEKAAKAGVKRVFIGLENINPDNLMAAKKRQNRITEYRLMLQQWRDKGVFTYAGYILGFPHDTKATILRDIEIIKKELPIDVLEFFYLTPLPGSEDHKKMLEAGMWMDPDLNKYNLNNRVTHHPKMSDAEWEEASREAWLSYFSPAHFETVLYRHATRPGVSARHMKRLFFYWSEFHMLYEAEDVHPLEGGFVRLRSRTDRRPGMRIEHRLVHYPKFAVETARKAFVYGKLIARNYLIYRRVINDPNRFAYTDTALTPSTAADFETLELFSNTTGGTTAVEQKHRDDERRARVNALVAHRGG
jgi:hypothetical protein